MALTRNQQRAVECTGKPLFIQAGAGTGKTFTLTKRLARGLCTGDIGGVENLLTITFTNKAAAELLGRVRAELRAQGLADAALGIDAAWISTIHAMCQRMLSAHAFDVGIDPGMQLLDDLSSGELLAQATDAVLGAHAASEELALLVTALGSAENVRAAITGVVNLFGGVQDGAASFELGPEPSCSGTQLVLGAHDAWLRASQALVESGFAATSATAAQYCANVAERVEACAEVLRGEDADTLSYLQACELFERAGTFKHGKAKAQPGRGILDECCERVEQLAAQARAALLREQACVLLAFADESSRLHRELKRAQGALDISDVLVGTCHLLQRRPDIAQRYRERFASVMVDEFQDTDRLQVAIVRALCDEDLHTLATVGDAQQSIYRFRGADLEVYREMRAEMRAHGAVEVALDTNFRSHSGILQFVEAVFATPEFFGGEFLRVGPGPANDRELAWVGADEARVHVQLLAGAADASGSYPLLAQLREAEAEAVADAFAALHERGAGYGDMAVLLRKMTNAELYRAALRARGVPCIVSGGSLFYTSAEVKAAVMLLRFIENPDDDEACFELLCSHLFDVSDDELLELATLRSDVLRVPAPGLRTRATLYDALCAYARDAGGDTLAVRAQRVLSEALAQAPTTPYSIVIERVVKASGLYASLRARGVEGSAVQGNIQRFCDEVDECERRCGHGIVHIAEHFRTTVELAESGALSGGKPATMRTRADDAVQIMTFHAAKGLEFPIVAVAEYESTSQSAAGLKALSENGKSYLAYTPAKSVSGGAYLVQDAQDCGAFARASSTEAFIAHASYVDAQREAEEAQRLLYVALTRAKDYLLLVGHDARYATKGELSTGQFGALMHAAFPEGLPGDGSVTRTRTGALVGMHVRVVQRDEHDDAGASGAQPAPDVLFAHQLVTLAPAAPVHAYASEGDATLRSYSSLARRADGRPGQPDAQVVCLRARDARDAADATAFGSAFHLVAQWLLACPQAPDEQLVAHVGAAARTWGLGAAERARLAQVADAWRTSARFKAACVYPQRFAEHAFLVNVGDVALEGFIDALCVDAAGREALVLDYKTGTSGAGGQLRERYALQASCYAYAVLTAGGYDAVELVFVRVEDGMREVRYTFTADDVTNLRSRILAAREGV